MSALVRPVIGEVRFAGDEQSRDRALEVVVDPQAAHRVVRRGVDAHRHAVGVLARDALVHLEEVAVALADRVDAVARDGVAEVEVDRHARRPDAAALVALLLRIPRSDVARHEVSEARVLALEEVVALGLGDHVR